MWPKAVSVEKGRTKTSLCTPTGARCICPVPGAPIAPGTRVQMGELGAVRCTMPVSWSRQCHQSLALHGRVSMWHPLIPSSKEKTGLEVVWDSTSSLARRGHCQQGFGKHQGCSEWEVDSEDTPWKGCIWLAEKAAPDWTPRSSGAWPSVPTSHLPSVPILAG